MTCSFIAHQGNRTTASCVAFADTERLVGDAAKNQERKNIFLKLLFYWLREAAKKIPPLTAGPLK